MIDPRAVWLAGFTRRWHTNPHLAHTGDRNDAHSARVAKLILALHPEPSYPLLRAALIHDDGESVVGDLPGPFKSDWDAIDLHEGAEVDAIIALWGRDIALSIAEFKWLRLADRLDAYLWAAFHQQTQTREWREAAMLIGVMADELGCRDRVEMAMGG